jgi:NADH dehydrogenase [ubiquinone] 1 alpha subcomplex assembly factor 7
LRPFETIIAQRIRSAGPISIAEYMELALTHPQYGYYMHHDPLGAAGDFITAPEISQIFGELIGAWLAQQWLAMGSPQAALVELGPGRGTLMADALRATRHIPGFHQAVCVHLVDASPHLRQRQRETLAGMHPNIGWHDACESIPAQPLLLIANEFFDALPIRQFINQDGVWHERLVDIGADDRLHFTLRKSDSPLLAGRPHIEGQVIEICEAGEAVAGWITGHIARHGGAALMIDYGYAGGTGGDTLQALHHRYHDVLTDPGQADLTAHVDFDALGRAAQHGGARVCQLLSQAQFLQRSGALARLEHLSKKATAAQKSAMLSGLERLLSPQQMGELFKVLCITHPEHPTPEEF